MERRVGVFVGSLRAASWNRKVAQALIALAPPSLQPEIVEIGQLPLFNQDLDDSGNPPGSWAAFRQQVKTQIEDWTIPARSAGETSLREDQKIAGGPTGAVSLRRTLGIWSS